MKVCLIAFFALVVGVWGSSAYSQASNDQPSTDKLLKHCHDKMNEYVKKNGGGKVVKWEDVGCKNQVTAQRKVKDMDKTAPSSHTDNP